MRRLLLKSFFTVAVLLLTAMPYFRAVDFGIVNYDDYQYARRVETTSGFTKENIRWAFLNTDEAIYMPLTWLSYMIDDVFAWRNTESGVDERRNRLAHGHSILIHALNAMLLFLLLDFLLLRSNVPCGGTGVTCLLVASIGSLAWSVHPLRVESVAWVASRKDVLSMFFLLTGLLAWCGFRAFLSRSSRASTKIALVAFVLTVISFVLGGLSKPSVMTFPALCFLMDAFMFRVVDLRGFLRPTVAFLKTLAVYVPHLLVAIVLAILAAYAQKMGGGTVDIGDVPFWWRCINAIAAYGVYLRNAVFPDSLGTMIVMRWPEWPRHLFWAAPLSLMVAGYGFKAMSGLLNGKLEGVNRWGLFAVLWFTIAISPMLGFSGFGYHAYADRFTYIPAIGLSISLSFILAILCKVGNRATMRLWLVLAVALIVAEGVICFRQVGFWANEQTLFERTLAVDGDDNSEAHLNLGIYHYQVSRNLTAATREFATAKALNPVRAARIGVYYIMALAESGRGEEAGELMPWLAEASRSFAGDVSGRMTPDYYLCRALWFASQGEGHGCAAAAREDVALCETVPSDDTRMLPYARGLVEHLLGNKERAIAEWRKMLAKPDTRNFVNYAFVTNWTFGEKP